MVKTKAALEEIEREAGRISCYLQAGDLTVSGVKSELRNVRELIDQLGEINQELVDELDRAGEDCPMEQELIAVQHPVEGGLYALGEAEDHLLDLARRPSSVRLARHTFECLDQCCDELTKAMAACKEQE